MLRRILPIQYLNIEDFEEIIQIIISDILFIRCINNTKPKDVQSYPNGFTFTGCGENVIRDINLISEEIKKRKNEIVTITLSFKTRKETIEKWVIPCNLKIQNIDLQQQTETVRMKIQTYANDINPISSINFNISYTFDDDLSFLMRGLKDLLIFNNI